MVIVPALNEAGAIAGVVESVHRELPDVPVLVIDDCSTDATVDLARKAGAEVVSLPRHLGLGGCVQTGYKLAYELGFHYVVRVDGDGQHDARDIPRIYARLVESGAHMVIGSRFVERNGQRTSAMRGVGIALFRLVLRVVLGKPVHDPTSGFVGVNRTALQVFSRTFPSNIPKSRLSSCSSAVASASKKCPAACIPAAPAAPPLPASVRSTTSSTCCWASWSTC
jgi:glycosyltransferase involved in cell wall biosynthesis